MKLSKETGLKIIFLISIAGILFSGYLSYSELFQKICPVGGCSYVLGFPACIYGLFMYLIIFIISLASLKCSK